MRKIFHPSLYGRILLWLLLNIAVLAAVFYGVLHWQFTEGLHGVLGGMAGDRLQAIGQQTYSALSARPRQEWTAVLQALGRQHDAQVALISPPDHAVAGDTVSLPPTVRQMMVDMHPELQARRGERGGPPPPPPRDELDELLFGREPDRPPPGQGPPPPAEAGAGAGHQPVRMGTFMLRAGSPERYYTGIRLPLPPAWDRRQGPLMLVIVTSSITGGGLYFDVQPWLVALAVAVAISALLWLPFVSGITRSIRASMKATEQIAKGRFDVRVDEDRGDELGRLAAAVNQMATQLDGIVRGQKRFLGDIAHELCGPIARMEMGMGVLQHRLGSTEKERMDDVRDELRQVSLLVNELLSFSRAALGQSMKPKEEVVLLALVDESAAIEGVPPQRLRLHVPRDLKTRAVPDLLRRAVGNLFRNALVHAPDCVLEVSATRVEDSLVLVISDNGPGVPAESLPRLFEPFYRVDTSRARETGGTGLGLSIVKTCVENCGGSVTARNRDPHGLSVVIELPCA